MMLDNRKVEAKGVGRGTVIPHPPEPSAPGDGSEAGAGIVLPHRRLVVQAFNVRISTV